MLDPEELYEVDSDVPDLTGAVLLHHLDGFLDAGSAGHLVAQHLLQTFDHRVVARFDVDQLIDYRARRPTMTFVTDRWAGYDTPELVVHLLHDAEGTPMLLLVGPEPDREWERFSAAVRTLNERWGIRLTVGFYGVPMGVPHTRPLSVTAHATRPGLIEENRLILSRLQVPGSATALLEYRLGKAGHDALGFAAHVPQYLAQSDYPTAALTLLGSIARATGLHLPDDALRDAAKHVDAEIAEQVAQSEQVADVVQALERQYDLFANAEGRPNLLSDDLAHLPTAEELGARFERFLAEQGHADPQDH